MIFILFSLPSLAINRKMQTGVYAKRLFYKRDKEVKQIKFSIKDMLNDFYPKFMCCNKSQNQHLYTKCDNKLNTELDLIRLMSQFQKVKALLAVMMNNDSKVINSARTIYVERQVVDISSGQEDHEKSQSVLFDFLEEDLAASLQKPVS